MDRAMFTEIRGHCENFAKAIRDSNNRHLLSNVCDRIHGLLNEFHNDDTPQDWQTGDCRTESLADERHQRHNESNTLVPIFEDFVQKIATSIQTSLDKVRHLEKATGHRKVADTNKEWQQKMAKMQKYMQIEIQKMQSYMREELQKMQKKNEELEEKKEAEKNLLRREISALSSKNDVLQAKISRFRLMADQLNSDDSENLRNVYMKRERK